MISNFMLQFKKIKKLIYLSSNIFYQKENAFDLIHKTILIKKMHIKIYKLC